MPDEVVLVKKERSFRGCRDEALGVMDVANEYVGDILKELLSCQLQLFIIAQVCTVLLCSFFQFSASELDDVIGDSLSADLILEPR